MICNYDSYIDKRWDGQQPAQRPALHETPFPVVAALGLAGECGEVVELLKKHMRDGKHPGRDILLEMGDVLHYLTVIARSYGYTLHDVAAANIAKLDARDKARADAKTL